MGNTYQSNTNSKKAEFTTLISDKVHFRTRNITRIKRSINQEDIKILNVSANYETFKINEAKTE